MSDNDPSAGRPAEDDSNRQKRSRLADALEGKLAEIEGRWLKAVQIQVAKSGGPSVSPTDLRDAIGDYLKALVKGIRGEGSIEGEGTSAWAAVAREHAVTRVRLGFDIKQLVREFIILRQIMVGVLSEQRQIAEDGQTERLADLIEAAIATSVESYIESRDVATRRQQAEHVGFVTHEIRNPLSTATMAVGRLKKRPEIAAAEGKTLDMLERAHTRIRTMIDQVLLTERLEAHEMECQPVDISLGQLMADATKVAQFEASQKGIGFSAHSDESIKIHVDPGFAMSALQNVVENAVKFTDHGRVEVVAKDGATEVTISVTDDCDGLSTEELDTIFEPFKRAQAVKAGTGLGLAIARRAMEAQGGRIWAESLGEKGCRFWLTLPKSPA